MRRRELSVVSGQLSIASGRVGGRLSVTTDHGSRTTDHARTGISLMEVLISIGIMAIGMVSIASLLPVGGLQVERANIEERKAELGLNAYREFQICGMGDPNKWVGAAPAVAHRGSCTSRPLRPSRWPSIR